METMMKEKPKETEEKENKCIFCKIVNKEIPASVVFENDNVMSFLDIMPGNKGHCLVIPKKHYETFHDIPDDVISELFSTGKKIAKAINLAVGNDAYNLMMNNGKLAGQIVNHAHLHIIPRFSGDNMCFDWQQKKYKDNEITEYMERIKKFL